MGYVHDGLLLPRSIPPPAVVQLFTNVVRAFDNIPLTLRCEPWGADLQEAFRVVSVAPMTDRMLAPPRGDETEDGIEGGGGSPDSADEAEHPAEESEAEGATSAASLRAHGCKVGNAGPQRAGEHQRGDS